jgi:hypothetical protein
MMDWDFHHLRGKYEVVDYGVNWDITNAVKDESAGIVTHQWDVWSSPDEGDEYITHRIRLAIKFRITDRADSPWTVGVSYHCQQALNPSNGYDPTWVSISSYDKHDDALAYLENRARELGWSG